ncbi:putative iron-dependent peroxidase [Saccharopolyspora antimicrobica]|uniref:Iron-dependent peroxidase n=2 Tax=Saccharopolyspora antimicrobica TaxID=455193 RepID=A0A1I5CRT5_9PSEU|nr:putative iron-dependent peroxidase [Saccharopolyspora antimicrobica]SFN89351.1 putative iron-dependent peroxidase [Saccharopolyspora antimicrobica]
MEMSSADPSAAPPEPQPVLTPLTGSAIFLVLTINGGGEPAVRDLLGDLAGLQRAVGFRYPEGGLACVAGIGSAAWDRLYSGPRPAGLHVLPEYAGPRHRAVSTPGDVLLHIRARQMFLCFELAQQVLKRLGGAVSVVDEVHGFKYWDQRDLLGFVDGTENPSGPAARTAVNVTAAADAPFEGASYVVVQKYLHDTASWNALPVEEQERVIGRTKLDDIELDDEVKPADSHVAVTTIVDADGTERQIVRDNMPFGSLGDGEFGTYFIGYAADPAVIELMLERMFLGTADATHDRILDFSTAVTGSLFVVPTADFLDDQPPPPEPGRAPEADASLRIGSLKGRQP